MGRFYFITGLVLSLLCRVTPSFAETWNPEEVRHYTYQILTKGYSFQTKRDQPFPREFTRMVEFSLIQNQNYLIDLGRAPKAVLDETLRYPNASSSLDSIAFVGEVIRNWLKDIDENPNHFSIATQSILAEAIQKNELRTKENNRYAKFRIFLSSGPSANEWIQKRSEDAAKRFLAGGPTLLLQDDSIYMTLVYENGKFGDNFLFDRIRARRNKVLPTGDTVEKMIIAAWQTLSKENPSNWELYSLVTSYVLYSLEKWTNKETFVLSQMKLLPQFSATTPSQERLVVENELNVLKQLFNRLEFAEGEDVKNIQNAVHDFPIHSPYIALVLELESNTSTGVSGLEAVLFAESLLENIYFFRDSDWSSYRISVETEKNPPKFLRKLRRWVDSGVIRPNDPEPKRLELLLSQIIPTDLSAILPPKEVNFKPDSPCSFFVLRGINFQFFKN